MERFDTYYGDDNTGNLYTHWNDFSQYVLQRHPSGVDLVTGDGGFDLEDNQDKQLLHRQEFLSSRLLMTQVAVGLACTAENGNFVVKVFDTVTSLSAQILYLLAQCFDRIQVFKPCSSRPANSERYIVCLRRRPSVQPYYQIIAGAASMYTESQYVDNLFSQLLPASFTDWLYAQNMASIERQIATAHDIITYLQGSMPDIPQYDIDKFLVIWNLPDTPPRRSRIRVQ